jgi:hypothetical protein
VEVIATSSLKMLRRRKKDLYRNGSYTVPSRKDCVLSLFYSRKHFPVIARNQNSLAYFVIILILSNMPVTLPEFFF